MRSRIGSLSIVVGLLVAVLALTVSAVLAGDPEPGGPPGATDSYTLADIYDRLDAGVPGVQSKFTEPATAPGTGTMYDLNEIMAKAPEVDNAAGAAPAHVLAGKTYWGLRTDGGWGLQTGTAPAGSNVAGADGQKTFSIPDGLYTGRTATANDSDLTAGNILSDVNLFGVVGAYPLAPIAETGQTTCWDATGTVMDCIGTGQDGEHQAGVAWPNPRFKVGASGVVADQLTGLVWLQSLNCISDTYPGFDSDGTVTWQSALDFVAGMTVTGPYSNCAAGYSDWRLPTSKELYNMLDLSQKDPALPSGHPFTGFVQSSWYWSGTSVLKYPTDAWILGISSGCVKRWIKSSSAYVWPVRGGQ